MADHDWNGECDHRASATPGPGPRLTALHWPEREGYGRGRARWMAAAGAVSVRGLAGRWVLRRLLQPVELLLGLAAVAGAKLGDFGVRRGSAALVRAGDAVVGWFGYGSDLVALRVERAGRIGVHPWLRRWRSVCTDGAECALGTCTGRGTPPAEPVAYLGEVEGVYVLDTSPGDVVTVLDLAEWLHEQRTHCDCLPGLDPAFCPVIEDARAFEVAELERGWLR